MRAARGFTLIELLVALFALALLAGMSWRGLDGMMRARELTAARADAIITLQTGLSQWTADLDALTVAPQLPALDWNGRVLRLLRRDTADAMGAVRVVAWTRREGLWRRWQSPPVATRGEVESAWLQADAWSQNPSDEARRAEVAVLPLEDWQIFYYRGDAWTNPLSSDARTPAGADPAQPPTGARSGNLPDGVRLILVVAPGGAISGRLVRDWVSPTVGGGKS